jgi:hypothetical protein
MGEERTPVYLPLVQYYIIMRKKNLVFWKKISVTFNPKVGFVIN